MSEKFQIPNPKSQGKAKFQNTNWKKEKTPLRFFGIF
jgi:hypothetical protein